MHWLHSWCLWEHAPCLVVCCWCHVLGSRVQSRLAVQVRKIDNGYLVAWHELMDYKIAKAGSSVMGSLLSGEGFVCTFTGVLPGCRDAPLPSCHIYRVPAGLLILSAKTCNQVPKLARRYKANLFPVQVPLHGWSLKAGTGGLCVVVHIWCMLRMGAWIFPHTSIN